MVTFGKNGILKSLHYLIIKLDRNTLTLYSYLTETNNRKNKMSYIALTATKKINNINDTIVLVFSNESTSLEAMSDMVKLGNKCHRFFTTKSTFIAYSNGANFNIEYSRDENGNSVCELIEKE